MKAWIDIDNPPQVQYVSPFVEAFRQRGVSVLVTARDYGITSELLHARGIEHHLLGEQFGASRRGKALGTVRRALALLSTARRGGRPDLLLSTSRSASMAAWMLRTPSFMILDYEHAETRSFRALGTTVLHPEVIPQEVFTAKGFRTNRLIAFRGIKEDISFAGRDIAATPPHDFGVDREGHALVLLRPPSETTHYYDAASRDLVLGVIDKLAAERRTRVVFSPRTPGQVALLDGHDWQHLPVVLERPVEFVSLLKGVDWVICAGGTMLREAAYLGVPTISIFRSEVGAVDTWLEQLGATRFVDRAEALDNIDWLAAANGQAVPRNEVLIDELTDRLLDCSRRPGTADRSD